MLCKLRSFNWAIHLSPSYPHPLMLNLNNAVSF